MIENGKELTPQAILVRRTVFDVVENVFQTGDLSPETTLESLGADSMEMVQLEIELETALGLPDDALQFDDNIKTVGDLIDYVEGKLNG